MGILTEFIINNAVRHAAANPQDKQSQENAEKFIQSIHDRIEREHAQERAMDSILEHTKGALKATTAVLNYTFNIFDKNSRPNTL